MYDVSSYVIEIHMQLRLRASLVTLYGMLLGLRVEIDRLA